jgi:pyrimidine operon attenuation protein/uracil phosphoribosyltransferase
LKLFTLTFLLLCAIATDFVGLELSTILKEHVDVVIDVEGEEDRVYLS